MGLRNPSGRPGVKPLSDVLIRDIPDDVLAGIDAHAETLGVSRVEYVRRRLAQATRTARVPVCREDLQRFGSVVTGFAVCTDPALWSDRIQHGPERGASIPDLIIAASAELAGLHVLHVDKDFDAIAALTGQPITRLDDVAD